MQVRFVIAPFLPTHQPSLGVSSLLSVLEREGIGGDAHYLNLAYGEQLGWELYHYLTDLLPTSFLPGELVFSRALWGDRARSLEDYSERVIAWLTRVATGGDSAVSELVGQWTRHTETLRAAMADAPRIISAWADRVLDGSPRVLGFTSTFQQSVAALALAQEVRRRVPPEDVAIMFGGANCEDEMGRALADNFPFIDCVVSGEGEDVIVDLVRRLISGEQVPRFVQVTMVRDMDALPLPQFDDYFEAVQQTDFSASAWLAAESSRGCWWGFKSHCTFCGLNGGTMMFRSKSAGRFAEELQALSEKYGSTRFALTDNILDMGYLRTLLPDLVAQAKRYRLFYETKSNLRKDQVELIAAAGVASLQPGIESFSTPILKLMNKGVTRLQNVQVLKWCAELGVGVAWNLLYGFPGEDPAEYDSMAELLPSLFHLPPPNGASKMRLDRFGPYWRAPERYGLREVRHHWSYDFAFAGLSEQERDRVAYFFDHEYVDGSDPRTYARAVSEQVTQWKQLRGRARLELRVTANATHVLDTRPCATEEIFPLTPHALAVVRALDGFHSRANVLKAVRQQEQQVDISEAECDAVLAELSARRMVIEENGAWLCLILDPKERRRVDERKVALRAERHGLRWPQDFPDPVKQNIVRAAMLALGNGIVTSEGAAAASPGYPLQP